MCQGVTRRSRRQPDAAHQIGKARVRADRVEPGIDLEGDHVEIALLVSLLKLLESAVLFAKAEVDQRQVERRDLTALRPLGQLRGPLSAPAPPPPGAAA